MPFVYLPRVEKKSGFRNAITGFFKKIVDKQQHNMV